MKPWPFVVGVLAVLASACGEAPRETSADAAQIGEAEVRGAAPVGRAMYRSLREIAPRVTLAMLGEDDGTSCTASFRTGPAAGLTAEEVLRLFGFNPQKQLSSDTFSFATVDARDRELWQNFVDGQDDTEAAKKVAELLSGPDVLGLATMVVEDDRPFGAPVFLLAWMSDHSIVGLRGEVGSMSF